MENTQFGICRHCLSKCRHCGIVSRHVSLRCNKSHCRTNFFNEISWKFKNCPQLSKFRQCESLSDYSIFYGDVGVRNFLQKIDTFLSIRVKVYQFNLLFRILLKTCLFENAEKNPALLLLLPEAVNSWNSQKTKVDNGYPFIQLAKFKTRSLIREWQENSFFQEN